LHDNQLQECGVYFLRAFEQVDSCVVDVIHLCKSNLILSYLLFHILTQMLVYNALSHYYFGLRQYSE